MRKVKENLRKITTDFEKKDKIKERMQFASTLNKKELFSKFGWSENGLSAIQVEKSQDDYGRNIVTHGEKESLFTRIYKAFINPFTAILFVLALVSVFTDIILAAPEDKSCITVVIITTMVMISGILRFVQETRSGNAAAKLSKMIHATTCVERVETGKAEISLEEVVVGDIIHLSAGDMIPADVRILTAKDLFVSQSALTGESEPVEKQPAHGTNAEMMTDISNLAFMGSNVISGSTVAVAVAVGNDTMLGSMAKELSAKAPKTSFEKGVNSVSWVLIRFMLIMVPVVLFVNGFTKGDGLKQHCLAYR